ncbi:MAG: hypothetical protein ACRD3E_18975 [Terriglobales bacterium]
MGLPVGVPQVIAGVLLAVFFAECLWIAVRTPLRPNEIAHIQQGQHWFEGQPDAESGRFLLVSAVAAMAVAGSGTRFAAEPTLAFQYPRSWRWLARMPFILAGLLLGASLWYVTRRLFGNAGGFIAVGLYVFSPAVLQGAAMVQGAMLAAWAAFGVVFTSIAVSHTLYAPRDVVLWNWRRILLLGISLALAVAAQPVLVLLAPVSLGLLLYLVPHRRRESVIIFTAACITAALLLLSIYRFHPAALASAFTGMNVREISPALLGRSLTWSLIGVFLLRMPAVFLMLLVSIGTYAVWKRPRYFGNTAPLGAWVLLMLLGITLPHVGGYALFLVALPFALVFIAGVFVDLLETDYSALVLGPVAGVLLAHAAVNIMALARIR